MQTIKKLVFAIILPLILTDTASADIYITNYTSSRVGQYAENGLPVNGSLITLSYPSGIVISNNHIFAASYDQGKIGQYTLSGAAVNTDFITGLNGPFGMAISGNNIFVANYNSNTIRVHSLTNGSAINTIAASSLVNPNGPAVYGDNLYVVGRGSNNLSVYSISTLTEINSNFITGLAQPAGVAVSDEYIYITNTGNGKVAKYTTSGALVNANFITGLAGPMGILVSGNYIYVVDNHSNKVSKFTISGDLVNANFITGLSAPVYLSGLFGPSAADTQSSMQYQASQLRSAFNTQTVAAHFALNYDCNIFDAKGMCISAGGRYTTIDNPNINHSAATVTLGYKVNSNIRVGAYLDQNININEPQGMSISNNTPLMGLYAVWNKEQSGLGYQVRLANTYQDKDVTQTRSIFGTSEAGMGRSSLKSQSYLAELSYAFQYQDRTLVRPYAGLRYTHLKQDGYTEATTDAVTDPLTVAAIRDKGTTALLGVKVNRSLTDKATLTAQLGLEQDVHHKVGDYSATNSDIGDLSSIAFNSNIKRTRPVASMGAFYDVTKTQRASASINYLQTAFQSTGSTTAFFNYMIGF